MTDKELQLIQDFYIASGDARIEEGVVVSGKVKRDFGGFWEMVRWTIIKLLDEIDRLKAERTWISVKDRLPWKHLDVLAIRIPGHIQAVRAGVVRVHRQDFSHWMPMPDPPK